MSVSSRALTMLAEALRHERQVRRTRWRRLKVGQQALLVLAYLRKGETYADLAVGFGSGVTTEFRYIREALEVLSARAIGLREAITVVNRPGWVGGSDHPREDQSHGSTTEVSGRTAGAGHADGG
jgi:hypothetical protein